MALEIFYQVKIVEFSYFQFIGPILIIITPFVIKNLPENIYKNEVTWVSKNHLALEIIFQIFTAVIFFSCIILISIFTRSLQVKWKAK